MEGKLCEFHLNVESFPYSLNTHGTEIAPRSYVVGEDFENLCGHGGCPERFLGKHHSDRADATGIETLLLQRRRSTRRVVRLVFEPKRLRFPNS